MTENILSRLKLLYEAIGIYPHKQMYPYQLSFDLAKISSDGSYWEDYRWHIYNAFCDDSLGSTFKQRILNTIQLLCEVPDEGI